MKLPQSVRSYVRAKRKMWPSLYGHKNEDHGAMAVLNHLYFVLGNGLSWANGKPKRDRPSKRALEWKAERKESPFDPPDYIPTPYCGGIHIQQLPEKMNTNWLKGYIWALEQFHFYSLSGAYEEQKLYSPTYMRDFVYRQFTNRENFEAHLQVLLTEAYAELEKR